MKRRTRRPLVKTFPHQGGLHFTKFRAVCINSNSFVCKFKYLLSPKNKIKSIKMMTFQNIVHNTSNFESLEYSFYFNCSDDVPTEIPLIRKAAIYIVSTIFNISTLGFLHGLAVVYVVVIDDLRVSSAEAALMVSVTRGVMYGSGMSILVSFLLHFLSFCLSF